MGKDLIHPKEATDILKEQLETGLSEYNRTRFSLFLSALTAGLEISFSVFLMAVVYTLYHGDVSEAAMHTMIAFSYPIGFILIVIGRSELFTEHTNLALYRVLGGRKTVGELAALWGVILGGNLLGGFLISFFLTWIGPAMEVIDPAAFVHLAEKMIKFDWPVILGSAILAGWLMGSLSWLLSAAKETASRITVVVIITAVIGMGGLHHSIVGFIELVCGVLISPDITIMKVLPVLLLSILGNIIGGGFFVAILKYNHVSQAGAH